MNKLNALMESYGYSDEMKMLESATFDSVAPAICMNADCDYTTDMEPDQNAGYCEICGTNTVKSCLVLAGIL